MQIARTQTDHQSTRRAAFGVLTALLLAAAVSGAIIHGSGWWLLAAFAIGPDLALLFGISSTLEQGQLHPRAVRLYNALHSGALAWALHISLDRALGYGMRTRDGFQRS
jgi:hypothetical protein